MTTKFSMSAIDRRQFLSTTAAAALMAGVVHAENRLRRRQGREDRLPCSADRRGRGLGQAGLDGLHIWADRVNGAGGVPIGGDNYKVEFVAYDDEYDPGKARTGAVKLIGEDGVKFIMMLGGDPWPGVFPVASEGEDAGLNAPAERLDA